MASELELIEAYGDMSTSLIKKAGEAAEKAFYALPDYRDGYIQEFVEEYENILFGARIQAARMAAGFHSEVARANGKRFTAPKIRAEDFTPENLRVFGERQEPYQARPFREVYKALSKGFSMTDSVAAGGARARILAQTDVQLARRKASLFSRRGNRNIVGYIRVLTGAENCGLCYVASTQRYNKNNLNPIHPGCDCGELPIYGDTDPGQVIDQYNLDRIHEAFENRFGVDDPGARDLGIGKAVQYKDGVRLADFTLISIREHGELGPILTRRNEKFLTLEEILERKRLREQLVTQTAAQLLEQEGIDLAVAGLASSARQAKRRVAAAQTPKKVAEIMGEIFNSRQEGWSITLEDNALGFAGQDIAKINRERLDATKTIADTLIDLEEKYPVNIVTVRGPAAAKNNALAYASATKGSFENKEISFTQQLLTSGSGAADVVEASERGHFPTWLASEVDPIRYVTTHEYGHLLDYQGKYKTKPNALINDLYKSWLAEKGYSPDVGNIVRSEFIREELSGYAASDPRELIAEAFADYEIRGEAAAPLSKKIAERLLKNYTEALENEA